MRTSAIWWHLYYVTGYLTSFQILVNCQKVSYNKVYEWAEILLCIQGSPIQISGYRLNIHGVFMVFLSCFRKNAGIILSSEQVITFPSTSFSVHCSLISPSFINTQLQILKTSLNKQMCQLPTADFDNETIVREGILISCSGVISWKQYGLVSITLRDRR